MNRNTLGKNLKNMLKNASCNPERVLFSLSNNKGYGGFHLMDITYLGTSLSIVKRGNIVPQLHQGLAKLGEGAEGHAYIGCLDTSCNRMVVIKVAKDGLMHEFRILKRIFNLSPHIPAPYMFSQCEKREMLYEQYANGGDLSNFLIKYKSLIKPIHFKTIVFQILWTLYIIQETYPNFRHNDLHLGNVLLDFNFKNSGGMKYKTASQTFNVPNIGINALMNDFGYTHMAGVLNPKVGKKSCNSNHGICRETNKLYDSHLFLNSLYNELHIMQKPTATNECMKFIESVLPPLWLGANTNKIKEHRLKPNANHSEIPSIEDMLNSMYFAEYHMKKIKHVVARPLVNNKKKSPSPNKNLLEKVNAHKKKIASPIRLFNRVAKSPEMFLKKFPNLLRKEPTPIKKTEPCGAKTGVGAGKLTTTEMVQLIIRKGQVPPSDRSRESLCAFIKEHKLNKVSPLPLQAPVGLKEFIMSTNIKVKQALPNPKVVNLSDFKNRLKKLHNEMPKFAKVNIKVVQASPKVTNNAAWKMKRQKLRNQLYNAMPKNGNYQNRMNRAGDEAAKMIRNMKVRGEKP